MAILYSLPSLTDDGTLETVEWLLSRVGDPDSVVVVSVTPGWKPTTKREVGAFYPAGRDRAVVVRGDTYGVEGPLAVHVLDAAAYDAVKALLLADDTLLLRSSQGQAWWLAVTGDVTEQPMRAAPSVVEPWPLRFAFTLATTVVEVEEP